MSSSSSRYEKIDKLGEGTYGCVYMAKDTKNDEIVAMKVMKLEQEEEGVSASTLREITVLRVISHCNIVQMKNLILNDNQLTLVFEHLDFDLRKLLQRQKRPLKPALVKSYAFQLLSGLYFLHTHRVMHRDIKPDNLLLDFKGHLKIGDFGLARFFTVPLRNFTEGVVTLWYRPPEVLLNNAFYDLSVDIWSAGCVIAEMVRGDVLFKGDSDIDMIHRIFNVFGTPTQEITDYFHDLKNGKFSNLKYSAKKIKDVVPSDDPELLDLVERMVCLDPNKRMTAKEALHHPFFDEIPENVRHHCLSNYNLW